jgi:flotillin
MNIDPSIFSGAAIAMGVLVLLGIAVVFVKSILHICEPNEVLVFAGREHRADDGHSVGFRVVYGGRAFRMPIFERVERMDMSLISVPMQISGAYSNGGIPLTVHAVANVKISADPNVIGNAIERFLGHSRADIGRVAKETLEGHLRGVLATMTPEDVNEDRLKFADRLTEEAENDLRKLGIQLDVLKIQAVSDEVSYLDNIGRHRIAEILRTAEVAESDAVRTAEEAEAERAASKGVAETNARTAVGRKENELREYTAKLEAQAKSAEERAEQAAAAARAEAERELQSLRGVLESLRNKANITVPAEADRRVRELIAEGQAAAIAENGRAIAEALSHVDAAWKACGPHAMDMVVVQQLDDLFAQVTRAAAAIQPQQVNLLDGGDGRSVAEYARAYPATVSALLEQVGHTIGVDVNSVLDKARAPQRPAARDAHAPQTDEAPPSAA